MEEARLEFQGRDHQHFDVLATRSGIDIEMETDFETHRIFLFWEEWDRIAELVERCRRYKEVTRNAKSESH